MNSYICKWIHTYVTEFTGIQMYELITSSFCPSPPSFGRMPVVQAGDTGIIQSCHCIGCRNGAHRYNHDLASADSSRGAGESTARCTSWILRHWPGPASYEVQWSEAGDICYFTSLHIVLYFCIYHYYILFSFRVLRHYYKFLHIITLPIITYFYKSIVTYCYIIITSSWHNYHIIMT